MSHFSVIVLIPRETAPDAVDAVVEALLAPYDEGLAVAPHWVEVPAEDRALMAAHYQLAPDDLPGLAAKMEAWQGQEAAFDAEGRLGSWSTSNPDGHWDWWQLGGRWTGFFVPDYDPETDPAHQERCRDCQGSGYDLEAPWTACMNCQGLGHSPAWPTKWAAHPRDVIPTAEVPATCVPFALVTPDGVWHERGAMGWFGLSTDRVEEAIWGLTVYALLVQYGDTTLSVICDCHV